MRCMDATLAELRVLAAAVAAPSMAAAARALGVDKATVGRRLVALEQRRPGLFERRGGRVAVTAAGARALAVVGDLERDLIRLSRALDEDAGRGSVIITAPGPVVNRALTPALARFRVREPDVEVVLVASTRVLDVARGEADIAIRNVPVRAEGLVTRRVAHVAYALYASRAYLERRGRPPPRSLVGHDLLDYAGGTPGQPPLDWLPAAVRTARVVVRADDPEVLTRAAVAGLGIGALPGFLAEDEPALVRVGDEVVRAPVVIVTRADARRLTRVRAAAAWAADAIAAHGAWLDRPTP